VTTPTTEVAGILLKGLENTHWGSAHRRRVLGWV